MTDLDRQLAFLSELEKLKLVERKNGVLGGARRENSAEHSWHAAIMALLLSGSLERPEGIDLSRAVRMLLVHDIVEIDAGDSFFTDGVAREAVERAEESGARRIFGLLPEAQREELYGLWKEFDAGRSPDAAYAKAIDRLQPLLGHLATAPAGENPLRLKRSDIERLKEKNRAVSPELWELTLDLIRKSVERGLYLDE
jgi:putative hydrolase of HD superfamily